MSEQAGGSRIATASFVLAAAVVLVAALLGTRPTGVSSDTDAPFDDVAAPSTVLFTPETELAPAPQRLQSLVASDQPPGAIFGLVLHDGTDPRGVLTRAALELHTDPKRLRSATIVEAVSPDRVELFGPGSVDACTAETLTNAQLRKLLVGAEERIDAGDLVAARTELARADARLVCVHEPLDSAAAFRVFFLRGIVASLEGDGVAAAAFFRQARIVDPSTSWDPRFGTTGAALFRRGLDGAAPTATLHFAPDHRGGMVINGMGMSRSEYAMPLPPGSHLLQPRGVWTTSLRLEAESGTATLVVPAWLPWNAVSWVRSTERNPQLGLILGAVLDPQTPTYVVYAGEVWQLDFDERRWNRVEG